MTENGRWNIEYNRNACGTLQLIRKFNEAFINNYMVKLLLSWEANIDVFVNISQKQNLNI